MGNKRRIAAGWAVHPGEILKHEFMVPMHVSGYALARVIDVTAQRVSDVVLKKTGVSADMAVRLAKAFNTTPEFWMNLQAAYELARAKRSLKKKLRKIRPVAA